MTARVIMICHASTDAVRRSAFPADEPLDAQGRTRAAALAGQMPGADTCWSSPELRARQTAEALQLDAATEPMLRDCDYGAWRGRTFDEVHAQDPDGVAAWLRDPAATPHGGESIAGVIERVARWLTVQQTQHRQSLVVTHATVIRAAIVHAIATPPLSFWRIDIAPLSITRLSGTAGRWNLACAGC
jgi:broad specificity phosphatase PhoE